ncbi:MAG: hypothetical protein CBB92_03535 [Flammeovirgaceae bacterium TMED32]|nr:hypothetical protein [Rhodospirillaceae bacterium]OUU01248.1 MAG: hypothetical protein CBB92_03535 [Flammeovirgaceae bacterium TMED32]|tara:strand:+ start:1960 stop:3606 length:1647 start_codon:yes stop_codon:yes gene_type:complete
MISQIGPGIYENFRFLLAEVISQVGYLRTTCDSGSLHIAMKILDRSGYPDNLKMRIRDGCTLALKKRKGAVTRAQSIKAVESVAIDLDRISRLCRHCVRQLNAAERATKYVKRRHARMLSYVEEGLGIVGDAAENTEISAILKLANLNEKIGREYARVLTKCKADLKKADDMEPIIAAIFLAQRIEDMGDALQDIGDAFISANMGQQLSAESYRSLAASVDNLPVEDNSVKFEVQTLAQTRSGSQISGISEAGADTDSYIAVFKDGKRRKLKEERNKVNVWNAVFPGLAPKVLGYHKNDQSASLLLEHLPGQTLEQILISESTETFDDALKQLKKTLRAVWKKTHEKTSGPAGFMDQLSGRMDAICELHQEFRDDGRKIAGREVLSFESLIAACRAREKRLKSSYTVRIHGDFNLDNILYDPASQAIRFIDLHRSQNMDFVQDVSVFMVSLYRLQALEAAHRRRVYYAASEFYDFARDFARRSEDRTFELRLALGLARSFATSTRFILDKSLAGNMYLRARFLLEQVHVSPARKPEQFVVPVKELFIG